MTKINAENIKIRAKIKKRRNCLNEHGAGIYGIDGYLSDMDNI